MQELDKLSQEQLKERLQTELDSENPDRDIVLKIIELLDGRDPVVEIPAGVFTSWIALQKDKPSKPKWKKWTSIGAVAAVLAVVLFVVFPVFGAENIIQLIGRWTDSAFSYGDASRNPTSEFCSEHEGLIQVYNAVKEAGITAKVVPTWLPEGYILNELAQETCPDGKRVTASFCNDEDYIILAINSSQHNNEIQIEKEKEVQCFEVDGIMHYVFENDGYWNAVWADGDVLCIISAGDYDILISIMNSTYKEV